ncbi:FimV/HubP family polar landmark protein [Candidatus Albibeggiatoa sp. nov. NOAA]|uniref:FimV/HubP family polar landmark protein n=1 Tax=Candidatus Albibeggiatoa sp. nov. NOAA TaxID=3162724 RepID=UPI0033017BAC|nr:hypothetical protein [Thiotrichaceae bacterium]
MYLSKVILLMVLFLYLPLSHAVDQTYGPLRNGETLWTIAPKVKPSDTITRHQMIIALLHANPHAFRLPCNINSLKIKQTLNVPSLAEIEQNTHQQALEAYKEQNAAWKAYRKQGVEIQCEEEAVKSEPATEETTLGALRSPQPVEKVALANNEVTLPKLTPSAEKEEIETRATSPENETAKPGEPSTETAQLDVSSESKTSYLPVIAVLGVVLFVLILAFLFRDHDKNKPIPEDLT